MIFRANIIDNKKIKFAKAEIYTFRSLKSKYIFQDGTTNKAYNKVPLDKFLKLYDSDGDFAMVSCTNHMAKLILPQVLTGETLTYKEWYDRLYWSVRNMNFNSREASEVGMFDLAVHGIFSKKAKLPFHRFLGAKKNKVKVYASGISCCSTDKEIFEEATEYVNENYNYIKMKVGTNFGKDMNRDIERVKLVRDTIGKKRKLLVDANQAWNWKDALKFAEKIEQYDVEWFEEPINTFDYIGFKNLCDKSPIKIATGECFSCAHSFEPLIESGVKHFQPIPAKIMSVGDWFHVRDLAQKNNIVMSSGGYSQISAAFIASVEGEAMTEWLLARRRPLNAYFKLAPKYENGYFILPEEHGLPLVLDLEKLENEGLIANIEYFK